jgi:hypothetical protein
LEKDVDKSIEKLKTKRHFNLIEWENLKESVKLSKVQQRFKKFKTLEIDETKSVNLDPLDTINTKIDNLDDKEAVEVKMQNQYKNIGKMETGGTFKGIKKGDKIAVFDGISLSDQ